MLIYLLSELSCLFSELCYLTPCLLYMFPVVLFIISGGWIKVIIFLYCVTLSYDVIKSLLVKPIWYLYSALPSPPYFGSHLLETTNNYALYLFSLEIHLVGRQRGHFSPAPSPSLPPSRSLSPSPFPSPPG